MNKRSAHRSAHEWKSVVAEFHRSGLSVQAFCSQNHLALATFNKRGNSSSINFILCVKQAAAEIFCPLLLMFFVGVRCE